MTTEELAEAGTMSFWEHLEELRSRVFKAILSFLVGAGVAWTFKEQLLLFLTKPFIDGWNPAAGPRPTLHYPTPASGFVAYVKIAVLGGFVLSLPLILYQLWAFVAPGLYSKEKRLAIPFVVASLALFAGGAYFGWRFAFPVAFDYLNSFASPESSAIKVTPTVMIEDYLGFIIQALVAFGVVFEIPVVVVFLSWIGLINHTHLIKFGRYFVVVAFVLAAILTPPDPISQLMLAGPLCLLYGISIGLAWLIDRARAKKQPAAS